MSPESSLITKNINNQLQKPTEIQTFKFQIILKPNINNHWFI